MDGYGWICTVRSDLCNLFDPIRYIEAVSDKLVNKPGIRITGMLGDVMKESNEIAYTFSKIFLGDLTQNNNKFFETVRGT